MNVFVAKPTVNLPKGLGFDEVRYMTKYLGKILLYMSNFYNLRGFTEIFFILLDFGIFFTV